MNTSAATIHFHTPVFIQGIGTRSNQEDAYFPVSKSQMKNSRCFIVCDGVGGLQKGEKASRLVSSEMGKFLSKVQHPTTETIREAVQKATLALHQLSSRMPDAQGMATTMTALCIGKDRLLGAHIGDSRIYHFREKKIVFRTRDHSLVQMLMDNKEITEEEARNHPRKNIILKSINNSEDTKAEIYEWTDIRKGDYFLLCTDGLLEAWDDTQLAALFDGQNTTEQIANQLKTSCAEHSKDNYTACLLQVAAAPKQGWFQKLKSFLNP